MKMSLLTAIVVGGSTALWAGSEPIVIYSQNFDRFPDGTEMLDDGSVMAGRAEIVSGKLQLSINDNAIMSAFWIPPHPLSTNGWVAEFDYSITDASPSPPADGFSLSYGNIPAGELSPAAEEGFPGFSPVLSFEMDTWLLDTPEVGPAIAVDDIDIPGGFINGPILLDDSSVSGEIRISMDPDGTVSFSSTGAITNAAFADLPSNFETNADQAFVFAARTGGASQEVLIDNLVISAQLDPVDTIADIESISANGASVMIEIPSSRGRRIGVEYSPDLSPDSWVQLGNFFEIDDCKSRFVDPDAARAGRMQGYYRAFLRPLVP